MLLFVHRSEGFSTLVNHIHLTEGCFEGVGWSKNCCQK